VEIADVTIYLLHDANELDLNPAAAGFHVVVSGHSHHPKIETRKGVLFLNPGSAGPRRFKLPITVSKLQIDGTDVRAEIITLEEKAVK
jgi:putative phosphoesterase